MQDRFAPEHENDRDAGFSLLEIMISITILGLLATIVVINVLPAQDQAMVQKARTDIATLEQALDAYRLDMREYPSTEQGLQALVTPSRDAANYREGGYIRRLPDDPWGNPYQYVYPGRHGMLDIYSLGRDGREGGEDLDADIGNWQG
ncbi:type II secretion system major pseudopilin GspG [Maricaulis sp.]|jgi:general secretion pathway protein G|uniref:type II secretion system major pseudopilin GspG n=1 Tax=Maricaulis sp. TaxID=1486257 RepID=UPI0026084898|nr:type II secretion system major pseudopilin GspG [Maricaulis sp.]